MRDRSSFAKGSVRFALRQKRTDRIIQPYPRIAHAREPSRSTRKLKRFISPHFACILNGKKQQLMTSAFERFYKRNFDVLHAVESLIGLLVCKDRARLGHYQQVQSHFVSVLSSENRCSKHNMLLLHTIFAARF
jgi:hypothetical protein